VDLFKRGKDAAETWQPKLWAVLIALLLVAAYLVAFVAKNGDEVGVDFVLGTARTSLVWVILLSLVLGLVSGVLLSQLYRRRGRHQRAEAADAFGDRGGIDEAER
jgi:uncharacterized integral membrane protein